MSETNVYQKIHAVQMQIKGYIKKDVKIGNYSGVSHDAVCAHIRDTMINHRLLSIPTIDHHELSNYEDRRGNKVYSCLVKAKVVFLDCDNPSSTHEVCGIGIGDDYGDKASGKAFSYAVKNIYLKVFNIETGENDESRADTQRLSDPDKTIDKLEAGNIRNMLEKAGKEEAGLLGYINKKYQISLGKIEEIPFSLYSGICKMLAKSASQGGDDSNG